jgi:hypothetical protein
MDGESGMKTLIDELVDVGDQIVGGTPGPMSMAEVRALKRRVVEAQLRYIFDRRPDLSDRTLAEVAVVLVTEDALLRNSE